MTSHRSRKITRSVDLSNLILDGDLVAKASHIVNLSRKGGEDLQRYYSVEDFVERALLDAVKGYEDSHSEIHLAPSGMSVLADPVSK